MIDYKALAERVERMARSYEERARLAHTAQEDRTGERHAECAADLRTVVTMLREMADQEPERFALVPKIPSDEVWQEAESAFHRSGAETFRRPSDMSAIWRDQISAAFRVFASAAPHPAPQPQPERQNSGIVEIVVRDVLRAALAAKETNDADR